MTKITRVSVLGVITAFMLSCACAKDGKTGQASGRASTSELAPDTVVASFGNKKITARELDAKMAAQLAKLEEKKFQARRDTLEQMVIQELVKAEVAKKGVTEEQWYKAEIDDKVQAPSDGEIKEMFEKNVSQLPPGSKLDEYRERIIAFMTQPKRQERAKAVFDELKKAANVEIRLPEPVKPRVQVEAKGPSRGPDGAKVTIVEFSDFQCPFCSKAHDTMEEVMQAYAGKIRLVFRHFPLEFHKQASKAAEASLCANEQNKFWEYHDLLFKNQQKLEVANLKEHAASLGLDASQFATCLDSGKHANVVKADQAAGQTAGVNGTPAFFINGVMLSGAVPIDEFKKAIDQELAAK